MKNLTKSQTFNPKSEKVSINSKRVYVNIDGTIAENRETYLGFKYDVIKSAGIGC